jgi:nucleoside-diphosphate-sugar epimerase
MKILISGSTGFVGSALTKSLQDEQHDVHRLIRPPRIAPYVPQPLVITETERMKYLLKNPLAAKVF